TLSTPTPRELYVEFLISQNRNGVDDVSFGTSPGSLASVAPGGTMTLMVGNTYFIQLDGHTATQGYEQIEYFINFPNTIFQILSVTSTFTADTSATVSSPMDRLYGDNCIWENNPASPNYRACLSTGKTGGTVSTLYEVKILQVPGAPLVNPQPLSTLIYDFSGSSFHYNADYDVATRFAFIVNASVEKSFSPKTIQPGQSSTLTFTVNNPGPSALSGVNFVDNLPAGVSVASTPNLSYNSCGTPTPASLSGGETSLSFDNITVPGLSDCTISVDVTAAADATYVNTSNNLFINTSEDTGDNASDTLIVTSMPPAPSTCGSPVTLATWTMPAAGQGSGGPPPPYTTIAADVAFATASATLTGGGAQTISTVGNPANSWRIEDVWSQGGSTAPGSGTAPYYSFLVDTSNYGGVTISADLLFGSGGSENGQWASNNNNYIYYYSSADGGAFSTISNAQTPQNKGTWNAGVTAQAATTGAGTTEFRINVTSRSNQATAPLYLDNVIITGCPRPEDPTLSKAFSPTTIAEGSNSTLTFTFANPNAFSLTGVGFSDTLPTGLLIATPNGLTQSCTTGTFTGATVTATAGTSSLDVSGGTLSANASCTLSVDVEGVVAGSYTNVSNPITSTETGPNTTGTGYGTSSLTVVAPPVINKSFTANPIFTGNTTTLNFTIANPNMATALTGVAFTDVLPAGLTVADGTFSACGGASNLTTTAATGTIALTGGSIAANGSCTFSVTVTGSTVGLKTNTTGNVTSTNGGTGNTATADVLVRDPAPGLNLLKLVGPTASGPWTPYLTTTAGADVYYRFVLENIGDLALTGVSIDDPTLTGEETCSWVDGDGTNLGTQPISLPVADASDNQLATCVFGPVIAVSGETTNTATGTFTGAAPADEPSSSATYATLTIDKDTSTPAIDPNGTVTYTIAVVNSSDEDLTNFQVTDSLPDFNGATAGNGYTVTSVTAPGYTVNIPGFDGATDTNLLAGTDTLANNSTATITITLDLTNAVAGTYDNTAVATTDQTGSIDDDGTSANDAGTPGGGADPENDEDVVVELVDVSLDKQVNDATPDVGDTVTFTLVIANGGPSTATNIDVTDAVPIGYTYVAASITGGDTNDDTDPAGTG
ncbi:MAG: DUF11 domain-containing protein, partial [Saprospiraceae bacterium]|nr:DUF11 domain-containing protein [Saprospiraceae bacterium]